MSNSNAVGIQFAPTTTAEEFPTDEDPRPCAYCNSDERVSEREQAAYERAADQNIPEFQIPDSVGLVHADYILRFGHEDGAGVEVPVCDMCLDGIPVEYDGETARSELSHEYAGNGNIAKTTVEQDGSQTIHQRTVVNDTSD